MFGGDTASEVTTEFGPVSVTVTSSVGELPVPAGLTIAHSVVTPFCVKPLIARAPELAPTPPSCSRYATVHSCVLASNVHFWMPPTVDATELSSQT